MTAVASPRPGSRAALLRPGWLLHLLVAAGDAVVLLGLITGVVGDVAPAMDAVLVILTPFGCAVALLLNWEHAPGVNRVTTGVLCGLALSILLLPTFTARPALAFAPAGLAIWALLVGRRPVAAVLLIVAFSGFGGTLEAYVPGIPQTGLTDVTLASLWAVLLWRMVTDRKVPRLLVWPGIALLAAYLALSVPAYLLSPEGTPAFYTMRLQVWRIAIVLLVAYAGWELRAHRSIVRGMMVIGALAGAYAMLRWAIGPSGKELDALDSGRYNVRSGGELGVFGSAGSVHALAVFSAVLAPLCLSLVFWGGGRWRLLAAAATGLLVAAILASEVRTGLAAVAVGAAVVLTLHLLRGTVRGGRVVVPLAMTVLALAGSATGLLVSVSDNEDRAQRLSKILAPTEDNSVQQRLLKWSTAMPALEEHPFGQGLGTAGLAHQQYGRFQTVASSNIDNSFLKVALDQGLPVMALFAGALVLLVIGMATSAVTGRDPERAAIAAGAAGGTAAWCVLLAMFDILEVASLPWIITGLGVAAGISMRLDALRRPAAERA